MKTITSVDGRELSSESILTLTFNSHLISYIERERLKFPFPAAYTPYKITVFFEDLLAITLSNNGRTLASEVFPKNYQPQWVEWKFDDECAFFQCNSDILIDRTQFMMDFEDVIVAQINHN